jgi:hypothetical protein
VIDVVKERLDVGPVAEVEEAVEPARGAVDCPAICDNSAGVKVPVIPVRVNLAEKAR